MSWFQAPPNLLPGWGFMDWWPFSRVRKIFLRSRILQKNPWNAAAWATFMAKFQAPKLQISEPKKLQVHTPRHSIPPLDSLLVFRTVFVMISGWSVDIETVSIGTALSMQRPSKGPSCLGCPLSFDNCNWMANPKWPLVATTGGRLVLWSGRPPNFGIVQRCFGKGVGNSKNASEIRQKCIKNAPKWVLFYWEKRNVPKCVRNASKWREKCAEHLWERTPLDNTDNSTETQKELKWLKRQPAPWP